MASDSCSRIVDEPMDKAALGFWGLHDWLIPLSCSSPP